MAKRLQRENARRAALNQEPVESVEALEDLEGPDVQLDQAAAIVTDLAVMREVNLAPEHTAQILQEP
jgi:hypothetical protein